MNYCIWCSIDYEDEDKSDYIYCPYCGEKLNVKKTYNQIIRP